MITLNMINNLAYHHDFNTLRAFYRIDSFIFSLFTLKVIFMVNAAICYYFVIRPAINICTVA